MTEQDKQLLLQDLCARLPYGVMMQYHTDYDWTPVKMRNISKYTFNDTYSLENAKPYLRPLSNMTEEEKKEYDEFDFISASHFAHGIEAGQLIDWLNAHHFDYRGLIPKGLALPAPEGMYN